jgi:hypothetical protein
LRAAYGPDAQVSTTYHYAIGPDGRRYITAAEVSIKGEEEPGGGVARKKTPDGAERAASKTDEADSAAVRELRRIEQEVIAHEAAHQAAGGSLTGAVSYTYTQGPDGRSYVTGGEVPIHVPASDDPEETLRNMEQVQRAAMAPGNPSGQDLSVAASAAAAAAAARQEIAAGKGEKGENEKNTFSSGVSSVKAGLVFERIQAEGTVNEALRERDVSADPVEAYGRGASRRGLWALGRGFEPEPQAKTHEPGFDIAA